jgi:hypothetical protein
MMCLLIHPDQLNTLKGLSADSSQWGVEKSEVDAIMAGRYPAFDAVKKAIAEIKLGDPKRRRRGQH